MSYVIWLKKWTLIKRYVSQLQVLGIKANIDNLIQTALPVLDAEGYAICPNCDTRVNCGTIGLANLAKHHHGKKICCSKCKRVPRKAADALNGCLCGVILNSLSNEVLARECKQGWLWNSESVGKYIIFWLLIQLLTHFLYHLQCVELEWEPRNWVCVTCEASKQGRGESTTADITIYRTVPDYVN